VAGLLLLFAFHGYAQKTTKKLSPGRAWVYKRCTEQSSEAYHVDTIKGVQLDSLVQPIYSRLVAGDTLIPAQDSIYLLLVNTLNFSWLDSNLAIAQQHPLLCALNDVFDKGYLSWMCEKYKPCRGSGVSPYFADFKILAGGNPFACRRYFVQE